MLTDWLFYGRTTGTNKFAVRTLSVLTTALSVVVAAKLRGVKPAAVVAACERIAQYIIDDNITVVYWTQYVYYKDILDVSPSFHRAEKDETFFYEDSSHSTFINSVVDEYYVDGWY